MKRRLTLSLGALVAAVSFSSCSSVDSSGTVAEVNGQRLSSDSLAALTGDSTDGPTIRETVTTWIEVVAVTGDASGLATAADLTAGKQAALESLVEEFDSAAQATYELALEGSPLLCLAAIPLDSAVAGTMVLDELAAGTTFAEAAELYSVDETLAEAGGIVTSPDGAECIDITQFNPTLIAALTEALPVVGEPVVVVLDAQEVVVLLRPYDELTLTTNDKLRLSANEVGTALREAYDSADISVSSRIGRWDAAEAQVVAVGKG